MSSSSAEAATTGGDGEAKSAYTTLGYLRLAREWMSPTLKKTAFLEKGVLTPEEFVQAGDELVFRCPTWTWEGGDPQRRKAWLPPDKQFLMTRNVPCQTRVADLEKQYLQQQQAAAAAGGTDGEDDDWLISSILKQPDGGGGDENIEDEFDILDEDGEVVAASASPPSTDSKPAASTSGSNNPTTTATGTNGGDDDDDDEYADMADFEDENVLLDEDATAAAAAGGTSSGGANKDHSALIKVRTYDLSITYDKYFQTPRLWMVGTSAEGQPLTGAQMMQDVMTDYANKTVTIEAHPHVAGPHASIHPCKHSRVMKTIVQNLVRLSMADAAAKTTNPTEQQLQAAAAGPSVEMYLFIFLKFVSSIIPTINYDFTLDVTVK